MVHQTAQQVLIEFAFIPSRIQEIEKVISKYSKFEYSEEHKKYLDSYKAHLKRFKEILIQVSN